MKYVKTVPIEAEQFDGSEAMIDKYGIRKDQVYQIDPRDPIFDEIVPFQIPTLEGFMTTSVGDYIATGIDCEHWAIDKDVFKKTYKPVGSDEG